LEQAIWEPNAQWYNSWKPEIPFDTLRLTLYNVIPQISGLLGTNPTNESKIIARMATIDLSAILPAASPVIMRDIEPRPDQEAWDSLLLWGIIYLTSKPYSPFDTKRIALFNTGN
jgi:hypothetical protein